MNDGRELARKKSLGESFSGSHNSLNFLRLALATVVVVSHAVALGGFGQGWITDNGTPAGTMAVYGFFGISGYLITGSAERNGAGRYLWQRFLRIFPGFWVCLVITAFFFALVAWLSTPVGHCGVSCYLHARQSPFQYVGSNVFLKSGQESIAGTPTAWPNEWNGSLWTLFYEFLCYVFVLVLAIAGLLRSRTWVTAITLSLWATTFVLSIFPAYQREANLAANATEMNLLKLLTIFMAGALIYLYRDQIPDSGWIAGSCAILFVLGLWLPTGGYFPAFALTVSFVLTPLIAYPLIWLGIHLPFQQIGARNDYSYGVYIYAYPVTVLLVTWHVARLGEPAFVFLCVVATVPFAVASWWLVEKRALRLKRLQPGRLVPRLFGPTSDRTRPRTERASADSHRPGPEV